MGAGHMNATGAAGLTEKHPDDVVVTTALRTAITKGGKGGFKDTAAADLLHGAFTGLIQRSGIDPKLVEDIAVGCVLAPGGGATEYRAAALAAGFPESTAVKSLNRQCSSGLAACVDIANAIRTGMIDVGVGAGVESMSTQYGPQAVSEFSDLLEEARHILLTSSKILAPYNSQYGMDLLVNKTQEAFALAYRWPYWMSIAFGGICIVCSFFLKDVRHFVEAG